MVKFTFNKWDEILEDEYKKSYFQELKSKLKEEYRVHRVYPAEEDVFNCLKSVDYGQVKLVILGQDPYHNPGQAHGYSFSVPFGIKIPPSLMNIYKELNRDLGTYIPMHGNLLKWAGQGVLLLNRVLTVRENEPNSHQALGWEKYTSRIIKEINVMDQALVFMLWGKKAQEVRPLLNNPKHLVLESSHPSPLSAHRGFFGCGHFSKANSFLSKKGLDLIDWQIDNYD